MSKILFRQIPKGAKVLAIGIIFRSKNPGSSWRMASINQDEVGVDMETGAQKPKFEIISELQGDRFIWVGDADAFNAIGAKVGKRVFKQNDTEKAEQLRQSIPDARERLMGRRK